MLTKRLLLMNFAKRGLKTTNLEKDIRSSILRTKTRKKVLIHNQISNLIKTNPIMEKIIGQLRTDVKNQHDLVKQLENKNAPLDEINQALSLLNIKKKELESKEASLLPKDSFVHKSMLDDVIKRRFFYDLSSSIYGGVSGFYDYGLNGALLMHYMLNYWIDHFVIMDDIHLIKTNNITFEPVLKASGHVDRFADVMVKDVKNGNCFRLDHLVKENLEKLSLSNPEKKQEIDSKLSILDGLTKDELYDIIKKYNFKSPNGNDLSSPVDFNLMFSTSIGPAGDLKAYLRPETAQGIFVNFKNLLLANHGRLPFGAAQIGNAFRNEISPRGGTTRMREFTMAEIEFFVDPENKIHPEYDSIKELKLNLFSAANQVNGESSKKISLKEAVDNGIVNNQVLAYFLARIYSFMIEIGIDQNKIRFRQHMSNEMAHYATDCWDCECLIFSGWLECIGCADRSCFDLTQHSKTTNAKLSATRPLSEPKLVDVIKFVPQKAILGKLLKGDSKLVIDELDKANEDKLLQWEKELLNEGKFKLIVDEKSFEINMDMIDIKRESKTMLVEEFVPHVIEPSFGIDRIMYCVLEHNFRIREDNPSRSYFTIPAIIAPIKCSILTLTNDERLSPFARELSRSLKMKKIFNIVDNSSVSIGRRYARTDEIGIPYGITIDFETLENRTVTLRDCKSTEQIRVDIEAIPSLVHDLANNDIFWEEAKILWPKFKAETSEGDN